MLTARQTAALLDGGGEQTIPILVRAGLLKPLGDPSPNASKYFGALEVLALLEDAEKLSPMRREIYEHWQANNLSRSKDCLPRKAQLQEPNSPQSDGFFWVCAP